MLAVYSPVFFDSFQVLRCPWRVRVVKVRTKDAVATRAKNPVLTEQVYMYLEYHSEKEIPRLGVADPAASTTFVF